MRKVRGDFGAGLREFNGDDDHVHLLAGYPPKVAVPVLVNSLKGVPARRLRPEFTGHVNRHIMHGHFWSPSYFAASCGGAPPSIIRQYIEQQRTPSQPTFRANPALKDEACARRHHGQCEVIEPKWARPEVRRGSSGCLGQAGRWFGGCWWALIRSSVPARSAAVYFQLNGRAVWL